MSVLSKLHIGRTMTVSSTCVIVSSTCPLNRSTWAPWDDIRPRLQSKYTSVPSGSIVIVLSVRTESSFVATRRSVQCVLPDGTVGWISGESLS
jgi:hypothetical protein